MRYYLKISLFFLVLNGYSQAQSVPSFFRLQRELPLLNLNTTRTISVADYGAIINDGNNDIAGITAAITAAVNLATVQNPVRLVFENGRYDLMPTTGTHALRMTNAKGVLWDAQAAEFMIHNPAIGFLSLLNCTNTIIKDLSVDYVTLPFSQGRVTKVDAANGFFEFRVDDNFPLPVESHFTDSPQRWGMFKNALGGIKEGTPNLIPHNRFFELIGTRTYKYASQSPATLSKVAVGDYFVHIARYNGSTVIENNGGKNLTYLNVIGYASPAGGFNGRNSEEWNVINCQLKLKQGRVHTTNADAMHVNGGKIGPWVENSLFEGFSDDCMNLKYIKRDITEVISPTQITVSGLTEVNDNLEFYNPRDGIFIGSARVTNVQNLGSNLFRLTLSSAVNITTINAVEHQLTDKAYIENKSNESFVFKNNIVRNCRRYGLLIQSKYALIENNLFQNLSGSGIRIENGVDWSEGFRADNIEIKNNRFENCGYDTDFINSPNSASIAIDFAKLKSPCTINTQWCGTETTNWQAHSNIRIIDNTILYNKRGLYLKNVNGLTVRNNFICHRDRDITLTTNQNPISQTILNSSNQTIESYNYTVPNAKLHFLLNELPTTTAINNSGTDNSVSLNISRQGGEITQGHPDSDIGYSFKINTENNGRLNLVNTSNSTPNPGPTQGAARTYSFWIKPEQAIFQTLLFSGGPTNGEVFTVQMQANAVLRVTDNNMNIVRMEDMPLNIGVWNHVAIVVPGNNTLFSVQLYKNGMASNETYSGSDALINTASSTVDFFTRFRGIASDIRYFDYQLCSSDVERIFNDRRTTVLSTDDTNFIDKNNIKVYPTLVTEAIFFSEPVNAVKVINILGQTFVTKKNVRLTELNLSQLPSGLYVVQINNNQAFKIYKK